MIIGKRIKQIRLECDLMQTEVAAHLGISQASYSRIESNDTISTTHLVALCDLFGVTPNTLLDWWNK